MRNNIEKIVLKKKVFEKSYWKKTTGKTVRLEDCIKKSQYIEKKVLAKPCKKKDYTLKSLYT